ncbi:ATP-binding protein [Macrococcoides bohemicum]|uniref:histidine kinase n=1 Tax=Macrococcoides bohemicum TaxID=1903056 RepID=A0AAJ4PAA0_9STAP|nr:ATP-binding protein [Macrococcus bohemicus]QYA41994.1 ATP-binding protein [Macrococcus bohemicus]
MEIFFLFSVLAMLSKLFSIYPVFSRSNKLNTFLKLNNYLIFILFIIAMILNITLQRSDFVLFSFIMLITVCIILLLSVFYVIFSIIRNSHGMIRRELYFILASLLLSILPMFTLNLFLHFFNSSIPYYYLLPTLIIFPLYLIYSFCKFKIIVSESFLSIVFGLFQIWNVLMLCSMIVFYIFFIEHPLLITAIIFHSLLLVGCVALYYFRNRYTVKYRAVNITNNINGNIYDTLIQNNIKLSNYYLFIETQDQSEQYKFPAGTFNYDDIISKTHMIYERSTIAINQLQDITVYVHRTAVNNAFIAFHSSEAEKFKYLEFVHLLEQFEFFMKNYSTKLMDDDYKNRIYLSHAALEEERERLSLFLHDDILQNIILALNETKSLDKDGSHAHIEEILDESIYAIREACEDLFPADLDDFGLNESLNSLIRRHLYESIIDIQLDYQESNVIIDKLIKISSYRMIKELINNAIKHADAKHIKVEVVESISSLSFKVSDDGKGIPYHNVSDILVRGSNNGLKYLINQVNLFDGTVEFSVFDENAYRQGLIVSVTLPLE